MKQYLNTMLTTIRDFTLRHTFLRKSMYILIFFLYVPVRYSFLVPTVVILEALVTIKESIIGVANEYRTFAVIWKRDSEAFRKNEVGETRQRAERAKENK